MNKKIDKTIIALSDVEHVRIRPTMYVGSVENSDERINIIKNNRLISVNRKISIGFYKLMNEILDNSFDEAKRMDGKMKKISISFNTKTNEVTVTDTGDGFKNAIGINDKTQLSNVETAMTQLRAGSNFNNTNIKESLIGTNGVGAAIVNMLSTKFKIKTTNSEYTYIHEWNNFETVSKKYHEKKKREHLGTTISYTPSPKIFKKSKWDIDYIITIMKLKDLIRKNNPVLKKMKFELFIDGTQIDLSDNFITENSVRVEFTYGYLLLLPKVGTEIFPGEFNYGTSNVSFINSAQCTGIHERILDEWFGEMFDYKYAYKYLNKFLVLDLPPKYVSFGDQNKTKFATGRDIIEPIFLKYLKKKLKLAFNKKKSSLWVDIHNKIKQDVEANELLLVKREKKAKKKKSLITDKYFAPSATKDTLFIIEGASAQGSINQKRNSRGDGTYAIRGKIKNPKSITDLAKNKEILDIMNILDIDPHEMKNPAFKKIVIATDADPDGDHIASILTNLFYKWFPSVIKNKHLYKLIPPLISVGAGKKMKYFYSLTEFNKWCETNKPSNTRYLKGLGSMSLDDWEWTMKQRRMFEIYADRSTEKYLDIAFGKSSQKRKTFLSN